MKNSRIFAVLLTLVMITGFYACTGVSPNSPSKTVLSLYESLKNKDYEKTASFYVTKDGAKLSESEAKKIEGLVGMMAMEDEKKGGLDKITINEEKIDDDGTTAKVYFTILYKNGDTKEEKVSLLKVENDWFIKVMG